MTEKPAAADDFDAIAKRLREIQQENAGVEHFDLRDVNEGGASLTRGEALAVAKMFKCTWSESSIKGCGLEASKCCLKQQRCWHSCHTIAHHQV